MLFETLAGSRALGRHVQRGVRAASVLLLASTAVAVSAAAGDAASGGRPAADPGREIIVFGTRLSNDVQPERELDEAGVESYGVSTVDDLFSELQAELGQDDESPLILVNGERMSDLDDIGALPAEVLRNVLVLPRGSAVRAGGSASQRVISLTLKPLVRSATLLAAPKFATDGGTLAARGEAIATYIRRSTRANLSFRARGEGELLESDRDIIQLEARVASAIDGNVVGFPDSSGEIDPLLSAAAGQVVTVAPVPSSANPSLADFAASANDAAGSDLGRFRTLRPRSRSYDLAGTFSTRLTPWLSSTATVRLGRTFRASKRGLPAAVFVLPDTNAFSPFLTDVGLAFNGRDPLRTRSKRDSAEASLTLNARFGRWTSNFHARRAQSRDDTRSERQDGPGVIALDDAINPFTADLPDRIAVRSDQAIAHSSNQVAQLIFNGPVFRLRAGDVLATIEGRLAGNRLRSSSSFSVLAGERRFRRTEQAIRGAIDVPLTSAEFLPAMGALTATAEVGKIHYSDAGTLDSHTFGLTWEPRPVFRLRGEIVATERPPSIQILGNPVIVTSDIRVFDPLTAQTVDVVQISGGNPSLEPERTIVRRLSGSLRPVGRLNLEINAEYSDTDSRNFISSLPDASAAVMLAFPDRFVRDGAGALRTVDLRPVNFDSHRERQFRYGFNLSMIIGGAHPAAARPAPSGAAPSEDDIDSGPAALGRGARPGSRTRLQLNANHSIVFLDRITIRPGLDSVDLLKGGAIGIAGGRVRHQIDATAGLSSRGLGGRLGATWRGRSTLESRVGAVTDTLRFSPVLAVNLRAFAEVHRFLPNSDWAKRMRLSLNVLNATNDRQKVRDSIGNTPLQYQPAYRDAVGRTIELEIRKFF